MDGNFGIGRFGGVEVRINWSWLAVFALIVWSLTDVVFPAQNPGLSDGTYLAMAIVTGCSQVFGEVRRACSPHPSPLRAVTRL
jgi:hypothetical protein